MKNKEKFANEIVDIAVKENFQRYPAVDKKSGKPVCCTSFQCADCLLNGQCSQNRFVQWMEEEYSEWDNVPIGTLVRVWDSSDSFEKIRHFAKYDKENCKIYVFSDGTDLFTADYDLISYHYGEIVTDEEAEEIKNKNIKIFGL